MFWATLGSKAQKMEDLPDHTQRLIKTLSKHYTELVKHQVPFSNVRR